jgi:hypothetical protein
VYTPLLVVLSIYLGEKWRAKWVQEKKTNTVFVVKEWDTYREQQNPLWCHVLWQACAVPAITLAGIGLPAAEFVNVPTLTGFAIALIVLAVFPILCFGFFVEVDDRFLTLRWGFAGFRLLHIPIDSIVSVEMTTFRPILDFGGWGMRWNGDMWAYFMSGTEGVIIVTNQGKKCLIGSDIPERLVQVIQAKKSKLTDTK